MSGVRERLDKGDGLWLAGHSPVSGGKGQLERQLEVRASLPHPPPAVGMHFLVDSYARRGHYFDMESLGYVVLASCRHDLTRSPVKLAGPFCTTATSSVPTSRNAGGRVVPVTCSGKGP